MSPPDAAVERTCVVNGGPTRVREALSSEGCHSAAITDALDEVDPDWRDVHDADVRRRRQ